MDDLEIAPLLYEKADDDAKKILREQYDVGPFSIKTISLERLFIDKLFAAEAYTRKSGESARAFEAAKHIYDLAVMEWLPLVDALINDKEKLNTLIDIRLEEEKSRLDGIPGILPKDFIFFDQIAKDENVKRAYEIMQNQYVLLDEDRIPFNDAVNRIANIKKRLGFEA